MEPLANKIRPRNLDEFVGQVHLVGEGGPLHEAIQQKHLFSFILWGPPGVGKTTLARIYTKALNATLFELSAVSAGKGDIRKLAEDEHFHNKVLFLDEIHRFNKAQQDFLLPHVENGNLTLIGATTENPSYEVIPALLSRCRVYRLQELTENDIEEILKRSKIKLSKKVLDWIVARSNGDARQALAILDNTLGLYGKVTLETLDASLQDKTLRYDKHAEEHHNTISAFIKSMRAGASDATLYYLARMLTAGEDPKFIARRMVIFASEDVGLAQPTALVVANEVFRACETIGLPECQINLAHGAVYLAQAKKDRRAYDGIHSAFKDIENFGNLQIPLQLRNTPTKLVKSERCGLPAQVGEEYDMYPKTEDEKKAFLPDKLKNRRYLK